MFVGSIRLDEALAAFDVGLAVDPRHALARFNRAESQLALGRRDEAALAFRQFLGLAPAQLAPLVEQARRRLTALEAS